MDKVIETSLLFVITYSVVFLLYYIFVVSRKRKLLKYENSVEVTYLKRAYKLDTSKVNMKSLSLTMALVNALIISIVVCVINFVPNLILKLLVGFVLLFPLIIIFYKLVAKKYSKKVK